jgi:hypothetical protein
MFLLHKKKKSFIWDFDSLMHWNHVSTALMHLYFTLQNQEAVRFRSSTSGADP